MFQKDKIIFLKKVYAVAPQDNNTRVRTTLLVSTGNQ